MSCSISVVKYLLIELTVYYIAVMYTSYLVPQNKTDDPDYFENEMIGDVLNAVGMY